MGDLLELRAPDCRQKRPLAEVASPFTGPS
jgi:hypothetical protein